MLLLDVQAMGVQPGCRSFPLGNWPRATSFRRRRQPDAPAQSSAAASVSGTEAVAMSGGLAIADFMGAGGTLAWTASIACQEIVFKIDPSCKTRSMPAVGRLLLSVH
jgi:hypothetical protein